MARKYFLSILISFLIVILVSCSGNPENAGKIAVEKITLNTESITIKAGNSVTLTARISPENATDKTLKWESNNAILSVKDGVVTASSAATAGNYIITVTSVSNPEVFATCKVTIEDSPSIAPGGEIGGSTGGESAPSESVATIDITDEIKHDESEVNPQQTIVSDPIVIDENVSSITLTNLESGQMYTLYPEKQENMSVRSVARLVQSSKTSSSLKNLGENYLFTVPEGQTEFSFDIGDMSLTAGDSFRIGEVVAPEIQFNEAGVDGIVINQQDDVPIFTKESNGITHQIFEKFFAVDLKDVKDKSHIAFLNVLTGSGSSHSSTNFGIIDAYGNDLIGDKKGTLLNFEGVETIYVYMYMEVISSSEEFALTLYLRNPVLISSDEIVLEAPNVYMFDPSDKERIVEISFSRNSGFGGTGFNNDMGARYASSGDRHPYFYPLSFNGTSMLMNLDPNISGYEGDSIIFDVEYLPDNMTVSAQVRERAEGDVKAKEITLNEGVNECFIRVTENTECYPIVFSSADGSPIKGAKVEITAAENIDLQIVASHENKYGYSQVVIPSYDNITSTNRTEVQFDDNDYLEYAICRCFPSDSAEKTVNFTVTV